MAVKLVVIYPRPKDVEAFEAVYNRDHVPMAVDREGRIGLMRLEQTVDRRHGAGERRIVQGPVPEYGREAGGEQHGVALPQRDIQMLGEQ